MPKATVVCSATRRRPGEKEEGGEGGEEGNVNKLF